MTHASPGAKPPSHGRPSQLPQFWRIVAGAVLVGAMVAGISAATLPRKPARSAGRASARAAFCGLVACKVLRAVPARADLPAHRPGISRSPSALPHSPAPSASAVAATPTSTPSPTPTPAPAPAPAVTASSPAVMITYSVPSVWFGGFQGKLTIINQSGAALQDWQLAITLPDDRVDSVWNADAYAGSGGSLFMAAASYDQVIEPGTSQAVYFTAQGPTLTPASCTFDNGPCG